MQKIGNLQFLVLCTSVKDFDGCNINGVSMCECLKDFSPKFQAKLDLPDWSS